MQKFIYLIAGVITVFAVVAFTQADENKKKALTANSIKFYGINYSSMKCIHKADFVDKIGNTQCESFVARYFTEWNEMFLTEKEKFDAKKYFQIATVELDLKTSLADVPNYNVTDCIVEDDNYTIPADTIKAIVKSYQNSSISGVGTLIIAESLNKAASKGKYYVTYFEISTGELLFSMKAVGEPSGIGFSSYWINSMHEAMSTNIGDIKRERKNLGVVPKNSW